MKLSKTVSVTFLLASIAHGNFNTECLSVSHSCQSTFESCDKIQVLKCSPGESRLETVWLSGKICNYAAVVANISNPESFITIAGPAALVPKGRTEPILVPFPDDGTLLFFGQCAEVEDFELDIDLCQNGFYYEVAAETDNCKASTFVSTMYKICDVISDVDCTIVSDGTKCEDVDTMGYSMLDCIQDVRYDFSYSNQNGNEKDSVVYNVIKSNDYDGPASSYTHVQINGTIIQHMNDYMVNIATGGEVSFSHILPNVNVCENIPNATFNFVAKPTYIDVSSRNDYTDCLGHSSYENIARETLPSIPPISSPPSMDSLSPTFSDLLPQTSAPSVIPSYVPTLRPHSKGGKKKPKRGKKAGKARTVPRKY